MAMRCWLVKNMYVREFGVGMGVGGMALRPGRSAPYCGVPLSLASHIHSKVSKSKVLPGVSWR